MKKDVPSSTENNFYLENTDLVSSLPKGNKIVPSSNKNQGAILWQTYQKSKYKTTYCSRELNYMPPGDPQQASIHSTISTHS